MPGRSSSWSTSRPGAFYFIEVNPRIQVEHTVTEIVTNVDLVKSQILIAAGQAALRPRDRPARRRTSVQVQGYAFQCRVTTEDPENKFTPDYGRITHYRSAGGLGIRIDGGPAITGGIITPFYDSLLVKICASGRRFIDAARRMERALQEFRVRGVKTNIPFLLNVLDAPRVPRRQLHDAVHRRDPRAVPLPGPAEPGDAAPDLRRRDHGQRLSRRRRGRRGTRSRPSPSRPAFEPRSQPPAGLAPAVPGDGARGLLALGPRAEAAAARPTRRSATPTSRCWPPGCGPATCSAWPTPTPGSARASSRSRCGAAPPSTRPCGSSRKTRGNGWPSFARRSPTSSSRCCCAGRTPSATRAIPTTSSRRSSRRPPRPGSTCSASSTRSTGSPTWSCRSRPSARPGRSARRRSATPATSSTRSRPKYDLAYYVELAKELEKRGANLIAIKDMAGLCKPLAAERLIKALREEVGVPIHFHTHDIGGAQAASVLRGAEVGLDIADGAVASMAGLDLAAELERDRRVAAVHPARDGRRPRGPDRDEPVLGRGARALRAVRVGPALALGRALRARDARRPVHEPVPAGQGARPGRALARGLQGLFAGQPALRRHHQGDAELEGRRRHGALRGRQQPDARRRARPRARAGVSRERGRVLRGPARPAAGRLPAGAPGAGAEGPAAADRAARRQPAAGRHRRGAREGHRRCSAGRPATATPSATCSIPASSPTWPPTSGPIPTRRSCRPRSSSSAPTRAPSTRSRSSRARR